MKVFATTMALVLAAVTHTTFAGVTPNTATSTLQRSGAKIAPAKDSTQSQSQGESDGQTDTAK